MEAEEDNVIVILCVEVGYDIVLNYHIGIAWLGYSRVASSSQPTLAITISVRNVIFRSGLRAAVNFPKERNIPAHAARGEGRER